MRLVFFGDSFSYGQGYPDCKLNSYDDVKAPSQFGWCPQVADILSCEYLNNSYPASSNQQILHDLRKYSRQPDDFIVIQWSYADRDMILNPKGITQIIPNFTGKLFERYYQVHSDHDMNYRSDLAIEHAALLLRDHKHLMLSNNRFYRPVDSLITGFEMDHCMDAWEDGHPGPMTNIEWAALVANMIKEKGP